MKFAGFSGTQRGRIKQYRKSGKMVGSSFHTGSVWGESVAGMAARTGHKELMFTFRQHPTLGIVATMSMGPTIIPEGDTYAYTEAEEFYYRNLANLPYVGMEDVPAGLVTWIRENY